MLTALLITILPTLLAYILLSKVGLKPKSHFLQATFAWFVGMYFFTFASFLLALLLVSFTDAVLLKATYTVLLGTQLALMFCIKDVHHLLLSLKHNLLPLRKTSFASLLLILFCLVFTTLFFVHHLASANNAIYTTPIYWDFHWHAALVNNFAYGDNFPPQNEAFSGLAHSYHYFWGVIAAIYEVAGLDLVMAINFISVIAFTFILIGIIGLSEELFHSKRIGFIAVLLTITSSSLHFLYYAVANSDMSVWQMVQTIVTTTQHPWYASFLPGNAFGYNGTMLNLFYFIEERQMIFGVVYLLLSAWILYKREALSNAVLFGAGVCMGAYFLWHLHITIMILCALIFLFFFGSGKKKTLILLSGFLLLFGAHYLYFKSVMQSEWFYQGLANFPRLNVSFGGRENLPFNLTYTIIFYVFSYGFKLFFVVWGLILLYKKRRKEFLLLGAIILPTFLILNTIQLSPSSIYENHKWFRPMNVFVDIVTAFVLYKLFFESTKFKSRLVGIIFLLLLTLSGIMENAAFFNSKPTQLYAEYPSTITKAIREYSDPQATFIGTDTDEIQLAGRKVFLGSTLGGDMLLKKKERKEIIDDVYMAKTLSAFCSVTKKYAINFVEFDSNYAPSKEMASEFPHFTALNSSGAEVFFVDVKKTCR